MEMPLNSPQRSVPTSVPTISGPSMLGLDIPVAGRPEATEATTAAPVIEGRANRLSSSQYSASQSAVATKTRPAEQEQFDAPRFGDLSGSSFREQSFSGFDSYIENEHPKSGAGRLVLLLVLLAALGAAGWWTYNNYRNLAQSRKTQSDAASAVEAPAGSQSTPQATPTPASPPPSAAKQSTPPSDVAEGPSENAGAAPDTSKPDNTSSASAPAPSAPVQKPAPVEKTPAPAPAARKAAPRHEPTVAAAAKVSAAPEAQPADTGEGSFRRAEAYLYGRGVPENCDEAVRNLKEASAKSNAKARSTFGTMYATGHCVPRDLPTSYLWFAMALRVDPNNQILEKDLTAVWNQMTPPERQMASRMKQ
jgi:cytoskeletal protein RodZ